MDKKSMCAHRAAVKQALLGISRLESMAVNYITQGKVDKVGKELTRSEFVAAFEAEAERVRAEVKEALTALALER